MKFLVLLLATVAFASASFVSGKYIEIKEDGTLYIKGEDGKQIHITKHYGPYGHGTIEIKVTGPNEFTKMYQLEYTNKVNCGSGIGFHIFNSFSKYNQDHHDIIEGLFREYLGYVDEHTYQQLLDKVQEAVFNGCLDGKVWYILHALIEDNKWDSLVSGYNFNGHFGGVWNKMNQQSQYGLGKLFEREGVYGQDYSQYDVHYYYNVLMKIFDRKVLKTILPQQQMYNQEMYGQFSYENMWDMIFTHEGIFDYEYLVQIISNEVYRNWFVQHGFFDKVVLDQLLYTYQTKGTYDQHLFERLFNTQTLKYFFIKHGVSAYDILGQTSYNQYNAQYYYNVLMKVFDRKVLKNILDQQQIYNQEMYGQYSHEKIWDMIFTQEGVFDYQYLVEIINNEVLRNWFVQHGFFDKVVLDQLLYTYQTEGTYDQYLLQRLFNTQALKYYFINHRISVYDILGQTTYNHYYGNSIYKSDVYSYNVLEKIVSVPAWRNVMVQYGIFYKHILDQILYRYKTEGVYDQVLLKQLVNKQALYKVLVQYGFDQTVWKQFVDHEYHGLNYLLKKNFFQETGNQRFGDIPVYNTYIHRYGANYWKNLVSYGQQYSGYSKGPSSYGKFYYPYALIQ